MAHGFLTPEGVSGDNLLRNINWLAKNLGPALKKLLDKEKKTGGLISVDKGSVYSYEKNDTSGVTVKDVTEKPVAKMLKGATSSLVGAGTAGIAKREQAALPPGGPRLPGSSPSKGGSFTNIPGVTAAPTPLNADTFFKQATSGTTPGGEYLSVEERKSLFAQSRAMRENNQPDIDANSGVDIVAAVNQVTAAILNLQSQQQQSGTDNVKALGRLKAALEEQQMELGGDYSGFMTPENLRKREKKKEEQKEKKKENKECGCPVTPFVKPPALPPAPSPIYGGPPGGGQGGFGLPFPISDPFEQWRSMPNNRGLEKGARSIFRRGAGRAAKRGTIALAGKEAAKSMTKPAQKATAKVIQKGVNKGAAKLGTRLGAKALGKIPGVGLLTGAAFGIERLLKGDIIGAVGEIGSGVASTVPGIGTGLSLGIDAGLAARDMMEPETALASGGIVTQPTTALIGENPLNPFAKKGSAEGVFPLEGSKGQKTFSNFGEGVLEAQKENKDEYGKVQAKGLSEFFDKQGGFDRLVMKMKEAGLGGNGGQDGTGDGTGEGDGYQATGDEQQMTEALIAGEEGVRLDAYQNAGDVPTIGYGQTRIDGRAVRLGDKITKEQAVGGLRSNITSHRNRAIEQVGADKWAKLDPKVRAVLSSIAYNYGSLPDRIMPAVRSGDTEKIAQSLSLLHGDNGGILRGRREREAQFIRTGTSSKLDRDFLAGGSLAAPASGGPMIGGGGGGLNMSNLPPLPPTDTLGGGVQRYGASRDGGNRKHAGVDFDISGNQQFFSRIGGVVTGSPFRYGADGWAIDIYNRQLGVYERIAEAARVLVKPGQQVQPGQPVVQGESGTGVIHYEIRNKVEGGFENSVNPLQFLSRVSSGGNPSLASAGGGGGGNNPRASASSRSGNAPNLAAANPNTGTALAASSAQYSAMGLTTGGGGNNIYNIASAPSGNQGALSPNMLPTGATAAGVGPGWFYQVAAARIG